VLSPAGSFVINDTNPQFDRRLGPNTHVGIGELRAVHPAAGLLGGEAAV